jgi:predicted small metal-binding protein
MSKVIRCPCGFVVRAESDDALVAKAQEHAKQAHGMELTPEDAMSMAQPS